MSFALTGTWVDEITDFLLSTPTPQQIFDYRASDALNQRLHDLLDKNREEGLTPDERAEMERFLEFDHIFTILKAKAHLKLAGEE